MDENPYQAPEGHEELTPIAWQESLWRVMLLGGLLCFTLMFAYGAYVGAGLWINLGNWQICTEYGAYSVACLTLAYWLHRRWRRPTHS
jgi:hypothetical protein